MNASNSTTDKNGRTVLEGDSIRVLAVPPSVIHQLGAQEQKDVCSMIGMELRVEEIDEHGCAWVTHWWDRGADRKESHSLGLSPEEMELVGTR